MFKLKLRDIAYGFRDITTLTPVPVFNSTTIRGYLVDRNNSIQITAFTESI